MRRVFALIVPLFCFLLVAPVIGAQPATPAAGGAQAASLLAGLGYPDLVVTSDGKTNDLPASLAAGRYHVVLHNTNATDAVDLDFYMAPKGTAQADAIAFYGQAVSAQGQMPELFYKVTIPGGVAAQPNATAEAIIDLKPGDGDWYAGFQIENNNGPSTGQAQPLALTGSFPTVTDPTVAVTASLSEFKIDIPDSVSTGPQVWKVTNTGTTPHFLALSMSDGSLTEANVQAMFDSFLGTPLPASATPISEQALKDIAGTGVLSPGQSMWIQVDLPAGQYLGACFLSGPGDTPMHAAMGMFKIFEAA